MSQKIHLSVQWVLPITIGAYLLALLFLPSPVSAINQIPTPDPKPGSYGIAATKTQDPPTVGATITTPGSGGSYNTNALTVSGICPDGLLVQLYNNGVMVGSTMCTNGSFTIEISLFAGINELSAIVYDNLEQAGPGSNTISVTYTDTQFTAFGALVTLTISYGRRSASAGADLVWPLQLSGGNGPYAFSVDWGDGSDEVLKSQSLAGLVNINHVFKKAGIYPVNVKVTDSNGVSAFLQVIALSNGVLDGSEAAEVVEETKEVTRVIWIPAAIAVALCVPIFWLGRRSQITSLRNKMLKERDTYKEK